MIKKDNFVVVVGFQSEVNCCLKTTAAVLAGQRPPPVHTKSGNGSENKKLSCRLARMRRHPDCFFFLSLLLLLEGRVAAGTEANSNTWPINWCACVLCAIHVSRDASAPVRTTSQSEASREAGRRSEKGSEGILAAQRRARDCRKQTMAPAATSPLALLCLCSLSLCGPTGSASPTQVRTAQWLLYGLETVAGFSSGHTSAPNVAALVQRVHVHVSGMQVEKTPVFT